MEKRSQYLEFLQAFSKLNIFEADHFAKHLHASIKREEEGRNSEFRHSDLLHVLGNSVREVYIELMQREIERAEEEMNSLRSKTLQYPSRKANK